MASSATAKKSSAKAKTNSRKRGGYSFGNASSAIPSPATAKKVTQKNTSTAKRIASKATSAARNNIDLGLASISRSASNAHQQTTHTLNDSFDRGSKVLRSAFANVATNAKQVQEKASTIGREVSHNLTQSASKAAQTAKNSLEIHRQNAEAVAQSYNTTSQAVKKATQDLFNYANESFANNVEAARAVLECRNVSEFYELNNELVRQNVESAFAQALKLSEFAIQTATQAIEPLNETVAKNSKKLAALVSK